ncbi:hypothetical protein ABVT39_009261 [Epinephelus coioides]
MVFADSRKVLQSPTKPVGICGTLTAVNPLEFRACPLPRKQSLCFPSALSFNHLHMRGGTTKLQQWSLKDREEEGEHGDERRRPLGAKAFDALYVFEAFQQSGRTEKTTRTAAQQEYKGPNKERIVNRDNTW